MKKFPTFKITGIIFCISFLLSGPCFCQFDGFKTVSISGLRNKKNLQAVRFSFDSNIYPVRIDSAGDELLIRYVSNSIRNSGTFLDRTSYLKFNISSQTILWNTPVGFDQIEFVARGIFLTKTISNDQIFLDVKTGKKLWKMKNFQPLGVSYFDSLIYGFHFNVSSNLRKTSYEQIFKAYYMKTGTLAWSLKMPIYETGFAGFYTTDSTLMFGNAGLNGINIKRRTFWTYRQNNMMAKRLVVQESDSIRKVKTNLLETTKIWFGMESNYLYLGDTVYHAGASNLVALNSSGRVIWQAELDSNETGRTRLDKVGENLILVNTGVLSFYNGGGTVNKKYGIPYLKVFNSITGNLIFEKKFDKNININDFAISGHFLFLLIDEKIQKFKVTNNYCSYIGSLDLKGYSNFFSKYNSNFISINKNIINSYRESDRLIFMEGKKDIIILDTNLIIKEKVDKNKIYSKNIILNDFHNNFSVYQKSNQIYFIRKHDNEIIYSTDKYSTYIIKNDFLFLFHDRYFDRIRISEL